MSVKWLRTSFKSQLSQKCTSFFFLQIQQFNLHLYHRNDFFWQNFKRHNKQILTMIDELKTMVTRFCIHCFTVIHRFNVQRILAITNRCRRCNIVRLFYYFFWNGTQSVFFFCCFRTRFVANYTNWRIMYKVNTMPYETTCVRAPISMEHGTDSNTTNSSMHCSVIWWTPKSKHLLPSILMQNLK